MAFSSTRFEHAVDGATFDRIDKFESAYYKVLISSAFDFNCWPVASVV